MRGPGDELISPFEARRVERMIARLHGGRLRRDESIGVSGWYDGDWLCVRWELANGDRSAVYPVDCRVDWRRAGLPDSVLKDRIYDFFGHFFDAYLREHRAPFTGIDWEDVDFAGTTLHIRGQVRNERAEREADALLERVGLAAAAAAAESDEA